MNKEKIKKILYRILKIIWIIIGIFLAIIAISLWIKISAFNGSGLSGIGAAIGLGILYAISTSVLIAYFLITILFLFITWLIKKFRRKNRK